MFTGYCFTGSSISGGLGLGPAKVIVLCSWVARNHTLPRSEIDLNSTVTCPLPVWASNSHIVLAESNHLLFVANGLVGDG